MGVSPSSLIFFTLLIFGAAVMLIWTRDGDSGEKATKNEGEDGWTRSWWLALAAHLPWLAV